MDSIIMFFIMNIFFLGVIYILSNFNIIDINNIVIFLINTNIILLIMSIFSTSVIIEHLITKYKIKRTNI